VCECERDFGVGSILVLELTVHVKLFIPGRSNVYICDGKGH